MTRIAALLLAACVVLAVAPAMARAVPRTNEDPLRSLGGDSPLCAKPTSAKARANCERSGSVEHAYPVGRYAFDWHIDTGVTHIDSNLAAAVQWLVSIVWQFVLWCASCILMVFQWAFSLDLLGSALRPVRAALDRLHSQVFGQPWFLAAVSVLGLWGLWNGLVRRRAGATAAGLGVAVLMMAGALALIAHPDTTVGSATRAINETKLGILAGVTHGNVRNPGHALEDASREIFDTIVLRPWCAVQFGDVKWCLGRQAGASFSRADSFLAFENGSKARDAEYKMLAEDDFNLVSDLDDVEDDDEPGLDDEQKRILLATAALAKNNTYRDRGKVAMQEQGRTIFRAGLVLLIVVGVLGWIALIGFLALQSLLQALLGLVLVLVSPVMLLAPAFGETGRRMFVRWATRLLATIVSGAIYALMLAITLSVANVIGEIDVAATFLAAWLLQLLFLWGVFFKRNDVVNWLSGNTVQAPGGGKYAEKVARRENRQQLRERYLRPTVTAVSAPFKTAKTTHVNRRDDKDRSIQVLAADQLADRGRQQLQTKYDAYHARLTTHDEAQRKLPEMRRRRDAIDRELKSTKLSAEQREELQAKRGRLTGQIRALEPKLMPRAEEGVARKFIETADRNLVESGQRFSEAQTTAAVEGLRQDAVVLGGGAGDERHAWRSQSYRPGVPEHELAKLPDLERAELHRHIDHDLERDRALFAALPSAPRQDRVPTRRRRAAAATIDKPLIVAGQREQRALRLSERDPGVLHSVSTRRADKRAVRAHRKAQAAAPVPSAGEKPALAVGASPRRRES